MAHHLGERAVRNLASRLGKIRSVKYKINNHEQEAKPKFSDSEHLIEFMNQLGLLNANTEDVHIHKKGVFSEDHTVISLIYKKDDGDHVIDIEVYLIEALTL